MRFFKTKQYSAEKLHKNQLDENPIIELRKWLRKASIAKIRDFNAMNLSTMSCENLISSRIVLLKEISDSGLVFFTNYNSQKAAQIENNPVVSVTFFWADLEKQIRIQGIASKLTSEENDLYFKSRNYKSQVASIVSPQSQEIESRNVIMEKFKAMLNKNETLQRPQWWGGYQIDPISFEFWQGRKYRLNDRLEYFKVGDEWKIRRLAP